MQINAALLKIRDYIFAKQYMSVIEECVKPLHVEPWCWPPQHKLYGHQLELQKMRESQSHNQHPAPPETKKKTKEGIRITRQDTTKPNHRFNLVRNHSEKTFTKE